MSIYAELGAKVKTVALSGGLTHAQVAVLQEVCILLNKLDLDALTVEGLIELLHDCPFLRSFSWRPSAEWLLPRLAHLGAPAPPAEGPDR